MPPATKKTTRTATTIRARARLTILPSFLLYATRPGGEENGVVDGAHRLDDRFANKVSGSRLISPRWRQRSLISAIQKPRWRQRCGIGPRSYDDLAARQSFQSARKHLAILVAALGYEARSIGLQSGATRRMSQPSRTSTMGSGLRTACARRSR